jgi:hypothetical protein
MNPSGERKMHWGWNYNKNQLLMKKYFTARKMHYRYEYC